VRYGREGVEPDEPVPRVVPDDPVPVPVLLPLRFLVVLSFVVPSPVPGAVAGVP
jgi:hypothetical protein